MALGETAPRDENQVTALLATNSSTGNTTVKIYADPTTHRLLVNSIGGGSGNIIVGTTTITGGSTGSIVYDNSGIVGEYTVGTGVATALGLNINGSGAITATTSPTFVTPLLGVATATTLAIGGATIGGNALAVTGATSLQVLNSTSYQTSNGQGADISAAGINVYNAGVFSFSSTGNSGGTADTILSRSSAATIQHGAANAASPINQTIATQGSRAGTDTNIGGANLTIQSGTGTGTGTPSTLLLKSPVATTTGTGAQTQTTGLTINVGTAVLTNYLVANLPAAATAGAGATAFVTDATNTIIVGLGLTVVGGGSNKVPVYSDGTNWIVG